MISIVSAATIRHNLAPCAELNDAKRRQMYAEMQRIVRDEGSVIIPMFASIVEAASTKLKYVNYAANYESDGGKLAERWWFA